MCMIDDCERLAAHYSGMHKARKAHTCAECHREIAPGETYEVAGGVMMGEWWKWKTCQQCIAAREWLNVVCSGFAYESVMEEMKEHFDEGYGPWLGRAYLGMRKKWRRKDGTLMPPMKLPANIDSIRA